MDSLFSKNISNKKNFKIIRNYVAQYITGNLGKIVENEEKITCYIKKNRCKKEKYNYTIACFGITKKNQELAEKYKFDR